MTSRRQSIADLLPGAWSFVSVVAEHADGSTSEPFGAHPKGMMIFTPDGHFSLLQTRTEVPRIAAGDRTRATPQEAAGIVGSTVAYCGRYVTDEAGRALTLTIQASTLANLLDGGAQRRLITRLTADVLEFTNPKTPAGVTLHTVWRRASAA
jgi:hypothetical protein